MKAILHTRTAHRIGAALLFTAFIFVVGWADSGIGANTNGLARKLFSMPVLSPDVIQRLQARPPEELKGRLQIGVNRAFDHEIRVQTGDQSEWMTGPNGDRVWSAEVHLPGAVGMRLHLEDLHLPTGVKLTVHAPGQSGNSGPVIDAQTLRGRTELWTDTVLGETGAIECHVPGGTDFSGVSFALKDLSHIYVLPVLQSNLKEGTCEIDVSCYPSWAQQASGIARMSFVDQGNTYLCTGCLLASSENTAADYFLTAHHCITSAGLASTIELYWFYQTASCNGTPPALTNATHTGGGADLLASSSTSDFSFMRLRQSAPRGAARLQWSTATPANGDGLTGIHHPGGAYKRISFGNFIGSDPSYWHVQWTSGVTEPGSSGSPLLNANGQVIGQLTGGFNGPGSSCAAPNDPDEYGRFDVTYPAIQSWVGAGGGGSGGFEFVRANYNGLFSVSGAGADPASSGSFYLSTTTKGKFSGRVQFAMGRYSFQGQLDANGAAMIRVLRGQLRTLTVQIQIDPETQDSVAGTISDDYWTAQIDAQRAVYDGRSNASPEAGQYTFSIPGDGYGADQPGGNSFGTVRVNRAGGAYVTCALADGAKFSLSSTVSKDARAPVFVRLYGGRGILSTWMNIAPNSTNDVSGDVAWMKDFVPGARYYAAGFNISAPLSGSLFTRPAPGVPVIDLSGGRLSLQGGGLDRPIADRISFDANKVLDLNSNKLTLSFSGSTGAFNGRWTDPQTGQKVSMSGVVLTRQNRGTGFFMGTAGSGSVGISN